MRKIYLLLHLVFMSLLLHAQVKEEILFQDDFTTGVDQAKYSFNGLSNFGSDRIGFSIDPFSFTPLTIDLDLGTVNLASYDSVIVEYSVSTASFNTNMNFFGTSLNYDDFMFNMGFDGEGPVDIMQIMSAQQSRVSSFDGQIATLNSSDHQAIISGPSTLNLFNIDFLIIESTVGTCTDFDVWAAINCHCSSATDPNLCANNLIGSVFFQMIDIEIDNLVVKGYTTEIITGQEKGEVKMLREIVASYNILGEEIPRDTKGEMVIVKYSDGSTERVFNQ